MVKKKRRRRLVALAAVLIPAVLIAVISVWMSQLRAVPDNYWKKQATGGAIEAKYAAPGSYEVSSRQYDAPVPEHDDGSGSDASRHFKVWYPVEEGVYPLVVMINGTGVTYQKYEQIFEHMASWGFVVIGSDYETGWNGAVADLALDFVFATDELARMVDPERIAVGGHSQGGIGTYNAVSDSKNSGRYAAAFAISATSNAIAEGLNWSHCPDTAAEYGYDLSGVSTPLLMLAGTGDWDAGTAENPEGICPLYSMLDNFGSLPDGTAAVMARRTGSDHGEMLWRSDPYVTAWLMYWLYDDAQAGQAFFGDAPELASNANWQDLSSRLPASGSVQDAPGS